MKPSVAATLAREPQSPTTLWLIRHAEVEERYQGIFGGQIEMNLSPRGHEQAASLARYLKARPFDAIYASVTQVALHPHRSYVQLLNFAPWRQE